MEAAVKMKMRFVKTEMVDSGNDSGDKKYYYFINDENGKRYGFRENKVILFFSHNHRFFIDSIYEIVVADRVVCSVESNRYLVFCRGSFIISWNGEEYKDLSRLGLRRSLTQDGMNTLALKFANAHKVNLVHSDVTDEDIKEDKILTAKHSNISGFGDKRKYNDKGERILIKVEPVFKTEAEKSEAHIKQKQYFDDFKSGKITIDEFRKQSNQLYKKR